MRKEVGSAVDFISNILRARITDDSQLSTFQQILNAHLCSHYQNHWFPEKPFKGSGFRCIRINHKMDPVIAKAGAECGMSVETLFGILPKELTIWVDPKEVSYRIGEDGSTCVLFDESESDSDNVQEDTETSSISSSDSENYQQHYVQETNNPNYIYGCKDQLRMYLPEHSQDNINLEYLSSYVSS